VVKFGYSGIEKVSSIPNSVARWFPHDSQQPDFLRTHCVEVTDEDLDERTINALYAILQKVEERHGQLAVFPKKYIRA
jgi:hypothetical protein